LTQIQIKEARVRTQFNVSNNRISFISFILFISLDGLW